MKTYIQQIQRNQELRQENKIWDRKSFEVRGHWPLWHG